MFTGIIQDTGNIREKRSIAGGLALLIQCPFSSLILGESIAVDGVCLTVAEITSLGFWCELSPETLSKTIALKYQLNQEVNLERALRLGEALGGHWVSGHVDGVVKVSEIEKQEEFWRITLSGFDEVQRSYLVEKGSIALSGISLTLNEVSDTSFNVMIIPHTWEKTTLKNIQLNQQVNVEFDAMAKLTVQTVQRYLKNSLKT